MPEITLKSMNQEKPLIRLAKDGTLEVKKRSKNLLRLGKDGNLVVKTANGSLQDVSSMFPSNQIALVYILLDNSGSMAGQKLRQAKIGAINFADSALQAGYLVGVISFSDESQHLLEPSTDPFLIRESIEGITVRGGTNLNPALDEAFRRIGTKTTALRSVLVVTDGQTINPNGALAIAAKLKSSGISILTIGTDDADYAFLASLASSSKLAAKVSGDLLGNAISASAKMLPQMSEGSSKRDK